MEDESLELIDIPFSDQDTSSDVFTDESLSSVTSVDLQPILDRLDTIELLLADEPVTFSSGNLFSSLDQVFLFGILLLMASIFLFRGK